MADQAAALAVEHQVAVLHLQGARLDVVGPWRVTAGTVGRSTGVPVYRVAHHRSSRLWRRFPLGLLSAVAGYVALRRTGFRPDVIHVHVHTVSPAGLLIGALARAVVVATEHSSAVARHRLSPSELRWLRWSYRRMAAVMPVGTLLARRLAEAGVQRPLTVVPNVVDTSVFRPLGSGPTREPCSIVAIGSMALDDQKGFGILLDAAARLRERSGWTLTLIGEGPAREVHERRALELELGDRVRFTGELPRASVAAELAQASALVVASELETFCCVAAEALACGTPVISTRCGGPEDFVDSNRGQLVDRSSEELAAAVAALLDGQAHYDRRAIADGIRTELGPEAFRSRMNAIYRAAVE